jgi:hypothetical protein
MMKMVGFPKSLKKVAKKLDVRVKPDPELAKKFDSDCSRRYINTALNMISFFHGVADKVGDSELKGYAKKIEKSTYHRDSKGFETYTNLYKHKLAAMGLWKSTQGISTYEKMKLMNKLRKLGKAQKEEAHAGKEKEPYKNRGDY